MFWFDSLMVLHRGQRNRSHGQNHFWPQLQT